MKQALAKKMSRMFTMNCESCIKRVTGYVQTVKEMFVILESIDG